MENEPPALRTPPTPEEKREHLIRATAKLMLGVERHSDEAMQPLSLMGYSLGARELKADQSLHHLYELFQKALTALTLCRSYATMFTTQAMVELGKVEADDDDLVDKVEALQNAIQEQIDLIVKGEDDGGSEGTNQN